MVSTPVYEIYPARVYLGAFGVEGSAVSEEGVPFGWTMKTPKKNLRRSSWSASRHTKGGSRWPVRRHIARKRPAR